MWGEEKNDITVRQEKTYYPISPRGAIDFFYRMQAKAVQLDGAQTLQASITKQSTGLFATKAAALSIDQKRLL